MHNIEDTSTNILIITIKTNIYGYDKIKIKQLKPLI